MQPIGMFADELLDQAIKRSKISEYYPASDLANARSFNRSLSNLLYGQDPSGDGKIHVILGYPDRCAFSEAMSHALHLLGLSKLERLLIVSERSGPFLVDQMISTLSDLTLSEIQSRTYSPRDWRVLLATLDWIRDLPISICSPWDLTPTELIDHLSSRPSIRTGILIDALQSSPWNKAWETHPEEGEWFFRELARLRRSLGLFSLISTSPDVRWYERSGPRASLLLPGQGTIEEVATFIEEVYLHLPDDLGIKSQSYVECRVIKNSTDGEQATEIIGWNEVTQQLAFNRNLA